MWRVLYALAVLSYDYNGSHKDEEILKSMYKPYNNKFIYSSW